MIKMIKAVPSEGATTVDETIDSLEFVEVTLSPEEYLRMVREADERLLANVNGADELKALGGELRIATDAGEPYLSVHFGSRCIDLGTSTWSVTSLVEQIKEHGGTPPNYVDYQNGREVFVWY